MGMYTEIFFRAEVDEEAAQAIRALLWNAPRDQWPDHPFFSLPRFEQIAYGGSYYFPQTGRGWVLYDEITKSWHAMFIANLKNYAGEIEAFFDWVAPHCRQYTGPKTFIGYSLYEENQTPDLWYAEES